MSEIALQGLVEALRLLPGVGVKSAQRMAFHLLQRDRAGAQALARARDTADMRASRRQNTILSSRSSIE